MKWKRSCGSAGGQRGNGSMLGEATLDVLGTFLGEAIRLLILFAAQHRAPARERVRVKGYEVHGLVRRASLFNTERVDLLYHDPHLSGVRLTLHYGDLTDGTGLRRGLERVDPDEVYNLGVN